MKKIAFIPVRGGSQSIKKKNIKPFNEQPLVYWVAAACQNCDEIDEIIIATDDQEIHSTVRSFLLNKIKIYDRSKENALDVSSTESVMLEYIINNKVHNEDIFILVQATSPFTTSSDLSKALQQFNCGTYDSLLSCVIMKRFIWSKNGNSINYDWKKRPRRQDFEGSLVENGAFYINTVSNIKKYKNRLSGKIGVYEMDSNTFIELDEDEDWIIGEKIMSKKLFKAITTDGIMLVLSDVDGVLTDAGMYYSQYGDEQKKFSTYDGVAFDLLKKENIKTGIITGEDNKLTRRRFDKLKLDYQYYGIQNKLKILDEICLKGNIKYNQIAYIGDDINDISVLEKVGLAACPKNAQPLVKNIPGIIQLTTKGGEGALREFINYII